MAKSVKQPRKRRTRVYVIKTADLDNSLLTGVYDILSRKNPLFKFVIDDYKVITKSNSETYSEACQKYREENQLLNTDFILLFSHENFETEELVKLTSTNNWAITISDLAILDNEVEVLTKILLLEEIGKRFPKTLWEEHQSSFSNFRFILAQNRKCVLEDIVDDFLSFYKGNHEKQVQLIQNEIERIKNQQGISIKRKVSDIKELENAISNLKKGFRTIKFQNDSLTKIILTSQNRLTFKFAKNPDVQIELKSKPFVCYLFFLIWTDESEYGFDVNNLSTEDRRCLSEIYKIEKKGHIPSHISEDLGNYFQNIIGIKSKIKSYLLTKLPFDNIDDYTINQITGAFYVLQIPRRLLWVDIASPLSKLLSEKNKKVVFFTKIDSEK